MVNCYSILVSTLINTQRISSEVTGVHVVRLPFGLSLIPFTDSFHEALCLDPDQGAYQQPVNNTPMAVIRFLMKYSFDPIIYYEVFYHDLYEEGGHDKVLLFKDHKLVCIKECITDKDRPVGNVLNDMLHESGLLSPSVLQFFQQLGLQHIRLSIDFLKFDHLDFKNK